MAFKPGDKFVLYWEIAYRLAYGDFYDSEENDSNAIRIFFFVITILIPLTLLNLLIALMGDIFDDVQSTRAKEDVRERLALILEISKFLLWSQRNNKERVYIH